MRWMLIPDSGWPRMIAQLIGAAPRSAGSSDAWTLNEPSGGRSSAARGRMRPYAATTETSGASRRAASRNVASPGRSGCSTGTPASSAHAFTGLALSARPRPAGRSGFVTTPAIS